MACFCQCIFRLRRRTRLTKEEIYFCRNKDIEFVIPPSKPPTTTLYGAPSYGGSGGNPTRSQTSSTSSNRMNSAGSESSAGGENVVNKGWNFLADVFTATSTLKSAGKGKPTRARSRDSLPVHNNNNSLDIPTIKTR